MSSELGNLALFGLVIVLTKIGKVLAAMSSEKISWLVGPRDETRPQSVLTGRLQRCVDNSVEAMVVFAPAVLIVHLNGLSTAATVLATQIFLASRILYVPLYALGTPWLRTVIWMVALACSLYLYWVALV